MSIFYSIKNGTYTDSLGCLLMSSRLMDEPGIITAYACMASASQKKTLAEIGLSFPELQNCSEEDFIVTADAENENAFLQALASVSNIEKKQESEAPSYPSLDMALTNAGNANICTISVPGEYAREVTEEALRKGLHCVVFSNNVPLSDERKMKELAREKGLLCMGPDCGVANINGAAFVLSSINNRGPVGIVGASGCGIQHVAALLHAAGSGVSQTIGTGGNDLKEEVGGITMLMGIDALEQDKETQFIVLISRKPADSVLKKILDRVRVCNKKTICCFFGADRKLIKDTGAIYAEDLDQCAAEACRLAGKEYTFESDEEISRLAEQAIQEMTPRQQYVRGIFCGGTYCDEAMKTMWDVIGPIHSNCPLIPEMQLYNSFISVENTVIDVGEEEFTRGKLHPTLEPNMRITHIKKQGLDPETAVVLMDFILTPAAISDPAGVTVDSIKEVIKASEKRGGKIAVVCSVLGTDRDPQNVTRQKEMLKKAGAYVMSTNRQAAKLAASIIRLQQERIR